MLLKGTFEERVDQAIAFARAHNTYVYDHEKISGIYRKAGVPYTKAAEKLFREWAGVFDGILFYDDNDNYWPTHRVDFYISFFSDAEDFTDYGSKYAAEPGEDEDDTAMLVRNKFGANAVPVATGGYYYPGWIYALPDGSLFSYHNDYDEDDGWHFDTFTDLLRMELGSPNPTRMEKIVEHKDISGTLDECIEQEIAFFKAHGGHQNCRLLNSAGIAVDIPEDRDFTDAEMARFLHNFFESPMPEMTGRQHRIWHVVK
jgi:hypothetical protein